MNKYKYLSDFMIDLQSCFFLFSNKLIKYDDIMNRI